MKKMMLMAFFAAGCSCAKAQLLQNTINSLTHFSTVYNAPEPPKHIVAAKPRKRKHAPRKPDYSENFKVCSGNTGYYICTEQPGIANATHPRLGIKVPQPNFHLDRLYNVPDPADTKNIPEAPVEQSYPQPTGELNASSYVIIYPRKNRIRVGNQH